MARNILSFTQKFRSSLITRTYKNWLKRNEKVLDVGCGTGVVSEYLASHFNVTITGCDINNHLSRDIKFVKMAYKDKLPLPKNSFDTAMLNDVLHHVEWDDQERLLREALRVSKKVLLFEVQPTLVGKLCDYLLGKIYYKNMLIPFTFRTSAEWKILFKKLPVKRLKTKYVHRPFFYPFSHIAFCLEK
ncbi:MAG: class I SAM-dependent methyltransferase [Candidatus Blackburnbacteria bacterium]|nr:class I SAM-dependent methyltransferase [Candidatus Blackburnbacteria bacterium]